MKRVVIFKNGTEVDGKVVMVPKSMNDFLSRISKKFKITAKRLFVQAGGEIDDVELIRDNDILYVSEGEPFVKMINKSGKNLYPQCSRSLSDEWITLNTQQLSSRMDLDRNIPPGGFEQGIPNMQGIQKNSKIGLPEESKDARKEKETALKPHTSSKSKKTTVVQPSIAKPESEPVPKNVPANPPVKRKSEASEPSSSKKRQTKPSRKILEACSDLNTDNIEECEDLGYVMLDSSKKSILFNQKVPGNVEKQLKVMTVEKKPEKPSSVVERAIYRDMSDDDDDDDDDHFEVIIDDPIPFGAYKKFRPQDKYDSLISKFSEASKITNVQVDANKRAVFKRLGEDVSQYSVSSTTAFEDDDQSLFASKKTKDETAKLCAEKHSVFNRLGQKCDVSSTSIEIAAIEERKSVINIEFSDTATKSSTVSTKNRVSINRKVKVEGKDDEDASSCVPSCVKSTYSEGILAANGCSERKLSMKDRLGLNKGSKESRKPNSDIEYVGKIKYRKSYPEDEYSRQEKRTSSSKKRVSFGTVSEKLIPTREEAIKNGELAAGDDRISVFRRLGFNRDY